MRIYCLARSTEVVATARWITVIVAALTLAFLLFLMSGNQRFFTAVLP